MVLRKIVETVLVLIIVAVVVTTGLFAHYVTQQRTSPQPSQSSLNSPTTTPTPQITVSQPTTSPPLSPSASASATPAASSSPLPSASPVRTSPPPISVTPPVFPVIPTPVPPKKLYPGEVTQYQGQNLASIADVYENAIAGTQFIDPATYRLSIYGLVDNPLNLTYDETLSNFTLYQKVVTIYCVEGWNATILWEGVLVNDLITQAGPQAAANTVIFHASDGYTTALPLSYLRDNNILLAYKMNGLVMPVERGFPFELVAQSQYGYKWIKWVTGIELSSNSGYLGYWESRGYPNNASAPS